MPSTEDRAAHGRHSPHHGTGLLAKLKLPEDVFPPGESFADSPVGSTDKERREAAKLLAHGPPKSANNSVYDIDNREDSDTGALANEFQSINAQFARGHPECKVWPRSLRGQLLSRVPHGGTMCIATIRQTDGTLSPPLILITGPVATAGKTGVFSQPDYLPSPQDSTPPSGTMPAAAWPDRLAPILFSVAPKSREIFTSADTPDTVLQKEHLLILPDYRPAMEYVPVLVHDGTFMLGQQETSPIAAARLWAPEISSNQGRTRSPNTAVVHGWVQGPDPLSPLSHDPWADPTAATDQSGDDDSVQQDQQKLPLPQLRGEPVPILTRPTSLPPDSPPAGLLLTSKLILLPPRHGLPVGHISDVTQLPFDDWLSALASAVGQPPSWVAWLNQPFLHAVYTAASSQPAAFALPLEPYCSGFRPDMQRHFATLELSSNVQKELEWTLHSHLHTDQNLATATKNKYPRLLRYYERAHSAADTPPAGESVPVLGWHADYFQTPLLPRIRPPSTQAWTREHTFGFFSKLEPPAFPDWLSDIECETLVDSGDNHSQAPVRRRILPQAQSPSHRQAAAPQDHQLDAIAAAYSSIFSGFQTNTAASPSPVKRARPQDTTTAATGAPLGLPPGASKHLKTAPNIEPVDQDALPPLDLFAAQDASVRPAKPEAQSPWVTPDIIHPLFSPQQVAKPEDLHQLRIWCATNARTAKSFDPSPGKHDPNQLSFHRQALLDGTHPFALVVRGAACWGAHVLPPSTLASTARAPFHRCQAEHLVLPGNLGTPIRRAMLPLLRAKTNTATASSLVGFLVRESQLGQRLNKQAPTCHFVPTFFTNDIVEALSNWNLYDEPDFHQRASLTPGYISSWTFVASIPAGNQDGVPKVPYSGFTADQIHLLYDNMIYFLHILFKDPSSYKFLGHNHSTFSRQSILGGALRHAQQWFHDPNYQRLWDGQSEPLRHKRTSALLYYNARLWALMADWTYETMEPNLFYYQVTIGSQSDITFLNTIVDGSIDLLDARFRALRELYEETFNASKLSSLPLDENLYQHGLPPFFTQSYFQAQRAQQKSSHRRSTVATAPDQDVTFVHDPPVPPPASAPAPAPGRQRQHGTVAHTVPIPGKNIAKQCMFAAVKGWHRGMKPISGLLGSQAGSVIPKISIPGSGEPEKLLCLAFSTHVDGGKGCRYSNQDTGCSFTHVDLADPATQQLPAAFFKQCHKIVQVEKVKPHYKPTTALVQRLTASSGHQ